MKKSISGLTLAISTLSLLFATGAIAYDGRWNYPHQNQPPVHAGQVDTDGILSPGEIPNPLIDYNHPHRDHDDYEEEHHHKHHEYHDEDGGDDYHYHHDEDEYHHDHESDDEDYPRGDNWRR